MENEKQAIFAKLKSNLRARNEIRNAAVAALKERMVGYLQSIPSMFVETQARAMSGASQKDAIKAKCQECCGFEDVMVRVGECGCLKCPLWPYRPYQK